MFGALAIGWMVTAAEPSARAKQLQSEVEKLEAEPATADRLAEQARLLHYLAGETGGSKAHEQGLEKAAAALALDDRNPAALLWWTAHRGSQATALNPVQAIQIAKEVERTMTKLRNVAPDFEHCAADRVLGHLYLVAPSVISVGSMSKAEKHLKAALDKDPTYPGNQLFYAELLLEKGQRCEARKLALEVEAAAADPASLDAPEWLRMSKRLLSKTEGACE